MPDEATMYRTRAATERQSALATPLDNVRDRCIRAAKAWEAMADRAERVDTQRRQREAATTARAEVVDAA